MLQLPNELLLLTVGYLDEIEDIRALVLTNVKLKVRLLLYLYEFDAKSARRALFWAAGCEDSNLALRVLEESLNAGANPNHPDEYLSTPLLHGIFFNSVSVVERLFRCQDIDVNCQDEQNLRTPLMTAALLGHVELLELLLARDDVLVNITDVCGRTALFNAVYHRREQTTAILLARADVDPNIQNETGTVPLMEAILNRNLAIARLLLARQDIDPNCKRLGGTALVWAIRYNQEEIVEQLLEKENILVSVEDDEGETALIVAVKNTQLRMVKLLLAKIQDKRDLGRALHEALDGNWLLWLTIGHVYCRTLGLVPFRKPQSDIITQLLVKHPAADPNYQDNLGYSPILLAASGYERGVELLIEVGADLNKWTALRDRDHTPMDYMCRNIPETGAPPLMAAIKDGHVRIVELLLNAGASPMQLVYGNLTPLSLAATCGDEDVVRLLLRAGVTWVGTDQAVCGEEHTYFTPLEWAVAFGYERIVEILLHNVKETYSQPATPISIIDEEQAYQRAISIAKKLRYKLIHEMLLREKLETWNASTTISHQDLGVKKVLRCVPHNPPQTDIERLVGLLRINNFMKLMISNDRLDDKRFYRYLALMKLRKYQIFPYASGSCERRWSEGESRVLKEIKRPYLCMVVSAADNPAKLVRELEKIPYVGAYAATFNGEIVAGVWTEPIPVAKRFYGRDGRERKGSVFMALTPYQISQPLDDVNLVDVYVRRWDLNVNLAAVVEQAAKNCNYFGRFVYNDGCLEVERTDPADQPWERGRSLKLVNYN